MTSALRPAPHSIQLLTLFEDPTLMALSSGAETHKATLTIRRETTFKTTAAVRLLMEQTIQRFQESSLELDQLIAEEQQRNNDSKTIQECEIEGLKQDLTSALNPSGELCLLRRRHRIRVPFVISFGVDCTIILGIPRSPYLSAEEKTKIVKEAQDRFDNSIRFLSEYAQNPDPIDLRLTFISKYI